MKTIATRGNIEMQVESGVNRNDPKAMCVLHSTLSGKDSPPMLIQKALKWGYWEKK